MQAAERIINLDKNDRCPLAKTALIVSLIK